MTGNYSANGFAEKLKVKKFEITFAIFRNSSKISNYVAFIRRLIFISRLLQRLKVGMKERDREKEREGNGIYLPLKLNSVFNRVLG